jgi:hypothetical protein
MLFHLMALELFHLEFFFAIFRPCFEVNPVNPLMFESQVRVSRRTMVSTMVKFIVVRNAGGMKNHGAMGIRHDSSILHI